MKAWQSQTKKFKTARIVLLLLITGLAVAAPLAGQAEYGSLPNKELSLQYTRMARQSAEAGNFERSAVFTDTALVFWEHNPDALYIDARAKQREGNYDRAVELLKAALSSTEFQFYSKTEILIEYLDLLVRFDRGQEALVLMQNLPVGTQRQQQFLQLACRALRAEGRPEQLLKSVRTGIELYPSDPFFQQHLINLDSAYRRRVRAEILRGSDPEYYGQEAYQALIQTSNRPTDLAKLLDMYSSRWKADLFSRLQSFRLNQQLTLQELERLFADVQELNGSELEMLWSIAAVFDAESDVETAFKSFSGTVTRDPDNDGEAEIRESYAEGRVRRVEENRDGDAEPERIVQFENGVPVWFEIQLEDNNSMKLYYQSYPELARAENALGSSLIRMKLVPYSVRYELPEWGRYTPPAAVPLPQLESVPPVSSLLARSAEIDAEEQTLAYGYSREKGRIETVRDSNTEIQADMLRGRLTERRRDSDGDGYYEIREYYRDGTLVRISYDGNKNGTPEYVEEYEGTPVRLWDTDEDGIIEYRMQLD
ncbi:MAG: hypothetical protein ACOCW5_02060 [Spirochaetia bacterium]